MEREPSPPSRAAVAASPSPPFSLQRKVNSAAQEAIATEALSHILNGKCPPAAKPPIQWIEAQQLLILQVQAMKSGPGAVIPTSLPHKAGGKQPGSPTSGKNGSPGKKSGGKDNDKDVNAPPPIVLQVGPDGEIPQFPADDPNFDGVTRAVNLAETYLGPTYCREIARAMILNDTVCILNLSQCDMGPEVGCELWSCLKRNKDDKLTSLDVSGNFLDSQCGISFADFIATNKSLKEVNCSCNNFGNDGAMAISEALHQNTTLSFLSLRANGITDDGARALLAGIDPEKNASLIALWINLNDISAEVHQELTKILIEKCPKPPESKKKKKKKAKK